MAHHETPARLESGEGDVSLSTAKRYWHENLRLMAVLLAVWALVSYGFGILLREPLDAAFSIGGAPAGFWFAQQGSIYVFVLLIFVYHVMMNKIDAKYKVEDESEIAHHKAKH